MKKVTIICFVFYSMIAKSQIGPTPMDPKQNVIQLALLLDVSNSMDGLIDQAKAELWSIVNEASKASKYGQEATLEIGLYEYGRSTLTAKSGYIKKLLDFTTDLDTISEVLFGLKTQGGDEYCGAVIEQSLSDLNWSTEDKVYKVIFIAGNEPFNQGTIDYNSSCGLAVNKNITINTIHCGDSALGVSQFWKNGADIAHGKYFYINQNAAFNDVETPYDSLIKIYNDSVNNTYWEYGNKGIEYKNNQSKQDKNAEKMGKSIATKRAISKSKISKYNNAKWDANDAYTADSTWIYKVQESTLPDKLKGKTPIQKKQILDQNGKDRSRYAKEIGKLSKDRDVYIKNKIEADLKLNSERTLGKALILAIREQGIAKGFEFAE